MLNYNNIVIWTKEFTNCPSCTETLFDVKIGRWLVKHIPKIVRRLVKEDK